MKNKTHKAYTIVLGIMIAMAVSIYSFNITQNKQASHLRTAISSYESSIPLITTPLHILAKGLNIVNK